MKKVNEKSANGQKMTEKGQKLLEKANNKLRKVKTRGDAAQFISNVMKIKNANNRSIFIFALVSVKIIKGKLGMPRKDLDFLKKSMDMQAILAANDSGLYAPPFNLLKAWALQNTALSTAFDEITAGSIDGQGDKATAYVDLKATLKLALAYINGLALLNQRQAIAIIQGCLMVVITQKDRITAEITVKQLPATGQIKIKVPSIKIDTKRVSAVFEWAFSNDGGVTWIPLPVTNNKCSTIAVGMIIGKPVIFRSRATSTKGGTTAWVVSKPITPE